MSEGLGLFVGETAMSESIYWTPLGHAKLETGENHPGQMRRALETVFGEWPVELADNLETIERLKIMAAAALDPAPYKGLIELVQEHAVIRLSSEV